MSANLERQGSNEACSCEDGGEFVRQEGTCCTCLRCRCRISGRGCRSSSGGTGFTPGNGLERIECAFGSGVDSEHHSGRTMRGAVAEEPEGRGGIVNSDGPFWEDGGTRFNGEETRVDTGLSSSAWLVEG